MAARLWQLARNEGYRRGFFRLKGYMYSNGSGESLFQAVVSLFSLHSHTNYKTPPLPMALSDLLIVIISASSSNSRPIFSYRDLDALCCKAFAQCGALNNARKFLRTEYLEHVRKCTGQNGCWAIVESLWRGRTADIDKVHFQARVFISKRVHAVKTKSEYRKEPSVRTLRSCKINHTPICPSGSVSLKALTQRLPIRLRVNMPLGADLGSEAGGIICWGDSRAPWFCMLGCWKKWVGVTALSGVPAFVV